MIRINKLPFFPVLGTLFLIILVSDPAQCRGTCKVGEFRCESGECIAKDKVCDSIRDCPSGIDEYVCNPKFRRGLCGYHRMRYRAQPGLGNLAQNVISLFQQGRGIPKNPGIFQCQFGGCIPLRRLCDGNVNCIGGSDESEICASNSCLPGQFRCKYGACIPDWQMCNGRINCPDGSDETPEACKYITCKPNEFRCRYGGCIPKDRICDIKKHCADGSDEYDFLCLITRAKMVERWGAESKLINQEQEQRFLALAEKEKKRLAEQARTNASILAASTSTSTSTTTSPIPIEEIEVSSSPKSTTTTSTPVAISSSPEEDSESDSIQTTPTSESEPEASTSSTSDSIQTQTTERSTPSSSSVDADISEAESVPESGPVKIENPDPFPVPVPATTTPTPTQKHKECHLPEIPENAEASIPACATNSFAPFCEESAPFVPPGVTIQYECGAGYLLYGPQAITCKEDGNWTARPPECDPLIDVRFGFGSALPNNFDPRCPSLSPPKGVRVECLNPSNLAVTSCLEKQAPGSEARYSCAPYHRPSTDLPTHYEKCKEDGSWSPGTYPSFTCVPDCGLSELPRTAYISHGTPTRRGQWPWHVAIYTRSPRTKREWTYICGGVLITEHAVLTSAHCVSQTGIERNASDYLLLLGKQNLSVEDTDPFVQKRSVSRIFLEDSFNYRSLDSDLAILSLASPAVLSYYVRPACYPQTSNSFLEEYQLAPGSKGTVVGFGFNENGTLSQSLRMTELEVLPPSECGDSLSQSPAALTRSTNYCAGSKKGEEGRVCKGDSGGGMYFKAQVRGVPRWYVQGLVSFGLPEEGACGNSPFTVFSRVGRYGDWIVRTLSRENLI